MWPRCPRWCATTGAGPQRWDIATRRRTLTRALVAAAGYSDALRITPVSHLYASQPAESQPIEGYLAGICLAINRAAWNQIGGFDEEFFLYGEETDWQERASAAGWRVLLADELEVEHGNPTAAKATAEPGATHGAEFSSPERRRNRDLLRANIALLLERRDSVHHADVYLAGTTLLERVQRSSGRHASAPSPTAAPTSRPS